jgi:hypothetical protein
LFGSQRALFPEPNTLSLEPVWELIESQPGFDPDKAVPPMCRLKAWESQLKVRVELPSALADLDLATREKKAMECNVGDDELYKVLNVKPTGSMSPAKKDVVHVIESSANDGSRLRSGVRLSTKIAAVFAVLGLAAAGISIYLTVGRTDGSTVRLSPSDLTTEIPLTDVRRNGTLIVATVTDPKWIEKSETERRVQLEAVTPKLRVQNASGLMILDPKGMLIATLRLDRKVPVTFSPR